MEPASKKREATALWLEDAGQVRLRQTVLPDPGPGELVIAAQFGAISRGTESLVAQGAVPEGEWTRMACLHQDGAFDFPIKYGYCLVGRVEAGPAEWTGKKVFCLHPHQNRALVSIDDAHPIPEAVPSARAVLAANMETAVNIVWDAGLLPDMHVCVFGGGVVGLLVSRIAAKIEGVTVTLVDIDKNRKALADMLGARFATPQHLTGTFDALINVSASGDALQQAIDHAAFEAKIVEASWYGDKPVELKLGGAFHSKRLSIISSQVGHVAPRKRNLIDTKQRMQIALSLLDDPALDALFSGETPFSALAETYGDILADTSTLCHRIVY